MSFQPQTSLRTLQEIQLLEKDYVGVAVPPAFYPPPVLQLQLLDAQPPISLAHPSFKTPLSRPLTFDNS